MSIFEAVDFDGHEEVHFFNDPSVGLKAIIAIHNTNLGPALGGCRMRAYASEADAVSDVLRLSRGMTYKAALLGVDLGGGKSVIIGDPRVQKTPALMRAMGKAIASLNKRYIVGEDIGTNPVDMREIGTQTDCVSCRYEEDGGYGDPAPLTALGVFSAMRAGVEHVFGTDSFNGVRVAVQGVGNVGKNLCRLLHDAGAELIVTDVYEENVAWAEQEFGARGVGAHDIISVEADVFSPCAVGAIINDDSIVKLKAKIVAGAANNQLSRSEHASMLADRGIVFLPDYVANAGGLASCAAEWYRQDSARIEKQVRGIYDTCREILTESTKAGRLPSVVADAIAEKRFCKI